jgi:transposase-like protein
VQLEFELLARYSRCWPVSDIMKSYLKNSSTKWRKAQRQKLAEGALKEVKKVREKKEKKTTRKLRRRSTSVSCCIDMFARHSTDSFGTEYLIHDFACE